MMRFPIASKLVFLTALLLLAATIPVALKSADQFEQVSGKREEDTTREQASARATEVESVTAHYVEKVRLIAALYLKNSVEAQTANSPFELAFHSDRDLVSIEVWTLNQGRQELVGRKIHEDNFKNLQKIYSVAPDAIETLRLKKPFPLASIFNDKIELRNATVPNGIPLFTLAIPLVKDEKGVITHVALANIYLDRMRKVFATEGDRLMYLVDREGNLLAHPDDQKVISGLNLADSPLVAKALNSDVWKGQMLFQDPSGGTFVGAYAKTSLNLAVIVQVSQEVILEPARQVRRTAFYITGTVLSLSLFFIVLFSVSLTAPLERLAAVALEVAKGNLTVQANIRSRDEVGDLARAFDQMTIGLQERDKMKNVLNKFHGSSVAEDLISRDAQLGGSRKNVTIFFSDIRDFTKFSEGRSPEEVVEMLNEYFRVMVGIIYRHKGIVDKFIGDAIMAVWGAPTSTDEDEVNAARCCLEMREALAELNRTRLEKGQTEIRIGMALHTGHAISGTIGSDQRMEYTVIGDTVNMTSRIEAATKVFGVDLLVSEMTAEILRDRFIVEEAGSVGVKGKAEALKLFKMRGYYDEKHNPVIVQTAYSDYEASEDDKVKVA